MRPYPAARMGLQVLYGELIKSSASLHASGGNQDIQPANISENEVYQAGYGLLVGDVTADASHGPPGVSRQPGSGLLAARL